MMMKKRWSKKHSNDSWILCCKQTLILLFLPTMNSIERMLLFPICAKSSPSIVLIPFLPSKDTSHAYLPGTKPLDLYTVVSSLLRTSPLQKLLRKWWAVYATKILVFGQRPLTMRVLQMLGGSFTPLDNRTLSAYQLFYQP